MGIGAYRHVVTLKQPGQYPATREPRVIVPSGAYQARILADGASAYWPLDDATGTTAIDLAGTAHGAISGGVMLGQPGVGKSKAMTFDGVTGKIVTTANVTIPATATLEAWVKYINDGSFDPLVALGVNQAPSWHLQTDGWPGFFDSAIGLAIGGQQVLPGAWRYVALTLTGTVGSFYREGVFNQSSPYSRPLASIGLAHLGADLAFGASPNAYLKGQLSDVAIYPRALSADEIAAHYTMRTSPPIWYCSVQSAAAQVIDGQAAYAVRGRFHPAITTETQLIFEGRTLQVQGIADLDERHTEIQLLCVEVVARA